MLALRQTLFVFLLLLAKGLALPSLSFSLFLSDLWSVCGGNQTKRGNDDDTNNNKEGINTRVVLPLVVNVLVFFSPICCALPWPCLPFPASSLLLSDCVSRSFYRTFGLLMKQICCSSSSLPEGSLLSSSLPVSRPLHQSIHHMFVNMQM